MVNLAQQSLQIHRRHQASGDDERHHKGENRNHTLLFSALSGSLRLPPGCILPQVTFRVFSPAGTFPDLVLAGVMIRASRGLFSVLLPCTAAGVRSRVPVQVQIQIRLRIIVRIFLSIFVVLIRISGGVSRLPTGIVITLQPPGIMVFSRMPA